MAPPSPDAAGDDKALRDLAIGCVCVVGVENNRELRTFSLVHRVSMRRVLHCAGHLIPEIPQVSAIPTAGSVVELQLWSGLIVHEGDAAIELQAGSVGWRRSQLN